MANTVYIGPSLPAGEVRRLLPGADIRPPVRHGDLARLDVRPGDRVLIVDGLFLHTAAVRHKEILRLLAAGVVVAGSSSMGALRAAELAPFGMRGIGQVFDLYRSAAIDGDDEVAILHATEEDGLRALSEPLVNLRLDLDRAVAAGILSREHRHRLLAALKAMPFRDRSVRGLGRLGGPDLAAWLDVHHVDAKAADARLLLAQASNGLTPPAAEMPITDLETLYAAGWAENHGGREVAGAWVPHARATDLVALTDPDFPRRYRAAVLASLVGDGDPVQVANERGLTDGLRAWLTPSERALAAAEAVPLALARAYGTRAGTRLSLARDVAGADDGHYRYAAAVTTFAGLSGRRHTKTDLIDAYCAGQWGCEPNDLLRHAWDRGFADLADLRAAAEPFAAHARWFHPAEESSACAPS